MEQVLPKVIWEECFALAQLCNKVPITMGRPKFAPKTAPYSLTIATPSNTPIPWPLTIPNGIRIQSAVLPQYTIRTDRWARRQLDLNSDYARYIARERRANNSQTTQQNNLQNNACTYT